MLLSQKVPGNPIPENLTTSLVPASYQSGEAHTENFCERPPIKIHLRRKNKNNYVIVKHSGFLF